MIYNIFPRVEMTVSANQYGFCETRKLNIVALGGFVGINLETPPLFLARSKNNLEQIETEKKQTSC